MDGVQQLADVVLSGVIAQIKEIEVSRRVVDSPAGEGNGILMEVVDGDGCSAVSCAVCKVRNDLLSGVLLTALKKVRCGCGGDHSVFQNGVAHLYGAEKSFVFERHTFFPFLIMLAEDRNPVLR
jgi:hypothetical protein